MADFRRWFIALAVLALVAGLASAQVGALGSTTAGALTCTANGAAIPQLRVEGYTELLGDILISCTGGPTTPVGTSTPIPTTNITVAIQPQSTVITSRLFASGGGQGVPPTGTLSEVVLLIDEPGSGLFTGAGGNYGPNAPQLLCTTGPGGCPAYVGLDASGTYEVAITAANATPGGGTNAANIYRGYLNATGTNTVTFYGVPVLPPVTSGVSRVFRITDIRAGGQAFSNQAQIGAQVTTSPSQVLPLTLSNFPVGAVISPDLTAKVVGPPTFAQCSTLYGAPPTSTSISSTLSFTEGFATAFKTRVVPLGTGQYAAEANNAGHQNIPGGLYGSFASNSESGFIVGGDTSGNYTAGLADFGTRLKAIFTNIPAGITLYVSNVSVQSNGTYLTPGVIGGQTLSTSFAVLVATGTSGESTSDGNNTFAAFSDPTVLTPIPLTPSSGVATAVWEVTNSQPAAIDVLNFNVYVAYTPSGATNTNPYGLPQITNPAGLYPGGFVNNVSLSYAPEPSQGAFAAAAGPVPGTNIIPRFSVLNGFNGPFVSIGMCQTTLLYPFVTANPNGPIAQGFDTGIAVANTSMDPFTALGIHTYNGNPTLAETGACTLYPYGNVIPASGPNTAAPPPFKGCDVQPSPVPGTNCFPIVPAGTVATIGVNSIWPGFQGYVIAVCNFQYAHGYAAVTDLGLRQIFSSYLALELSPNCIGPNNASCTNGRGVISLEQLVH